MITQFDNSIENKNILWKTEHYIYIKPAEVLASYISFYTISFLKDGGIPNEYGLIPDGTGVITVYLDQKGMHSKLWGTTTKINYLGTQVNEISFILLIEFRHEGLFHLMQMDQTELTDRIISLDCFCSRLKTELFELAEGAESLKELVDGLNRLLYQRIIGKKRNYLSSESVIQSLIESGGMVTSKELEEREYYSYRHLNRIFSRQVGMSIKSFAKLVRVNRAVRKLSCSAGQITEIAHDCGYYDQSHFIKDFKSICNTSPAEYIKNMSCFYNETLKY